MTFDTKEYVNDKNSEKLLDHTVKIKPIILNELF